MRIVQGEQARGQYHDPLRFEQLAMDPRCDPYQRQIPEYAVRMGMPEDAGGEHEIEVQGE